jgi:hypothetical protein
MQTLIIRKMRVPRYPNSDGIEMVDRYTAMVGGVQYDIDRETSNDLQEVAERCAELMTLIMHKHKKRGDRYELPPPPIEGYECWTISCPCRV